MVIHETTPPLPISEMLDVVIVGGGAAEGTLANALIDADAESGNFGR